MVAAGLLVSALAFGVGPAAADPAPDTGPENLAVIDVPATAEVLEQVKAAAEKTLSYNYADLGALERAVSDLTTGAYQRKHREIMGAVVAQAPAAKAVLTVRAVRAAVRTLSPTDASVLVFLDQSSTRDGSPGQTGASQALVTAARVDGRWKLSDIDLFAR